MPEPKSIKTNIELGATFALIQKIKKGIKQKCNIEISTTDVGVSGQGLRILVQAKNYKTKEFMYTQKIVTEEEMVTIHNRQQDYLINSLIEKANYYFRKEQSK